MNAIADPLPKRIPGAALDRELRTATTEYCELFDWTTKQWTCNQCGHVLDNHAHCPDHAPTHFPGLRRLECNAEPGTHPEVFMYNDDHPDYGPICFYCILSTQDTSGRWTS